MQKQAIRVEEAEEARKRAEEEARQRLVALVDADRRKKKEVLQQHRDKSSRNRYSLSGPSSEIVNGGDLPEDEKQLERIDDGLKLPCGDITYSLTKESIAENGSYILPL
jgi:hypothetical protein